jgi:hypothetical protein
MVGNWLQQVNDLPCIDPTGQTSALHVFLARRHSRLDCVDNQWQIYCWGFTLGPAHNAMFSLFQVKCQLTSAGRLVLLDGGKQASAGE